MNYVIERLKKYIQNGAEKFVIYPFGVNGVNVKNILKEYFAKEPYAVIDNEYFSYNHAIKSKDDLKSIFQEDIYIILTIENIELNKKIFSELSEFIPEKNIINLADNREELIKCDGNGVLLRDFLPFANISDNGKNVCGGG